MRPSIEELKIQMPKLINVLMDKLNLVALNRESLAANVDKKMREQDRQRAMLDNLCVHLEKLRDDLLLDREPLKREVHHREVSTANFFAKQTAFIETLNDILSELPDCIDCQAARENRQIITAELNHWITKLREPLNPHIYDKLTTDEAAVRKELARHRLAVMDGKESDDRYIAPPTTRMRLSVLRPVIHRVYKTNTVPPLFERPPVVDLDRQHAHLQHHYVENPGVPPLPALKMPSSRGALVSPVGHTPLTSPLSSRTPSLESLPSASLDSASRTSSMSQRSLDFLSFAGAAIPHREKTVSELCVTSVSLMTPRPPSVSLSSVSGNAAPFRRARALTMSALGDLTTVLQINPLKASK